MAGHSQHTKFFYNPHPGRAGAAAPCPKPLLEIANRINNTESTVDEVVQQLKEAFPEGVVKPLEDCILVSLEMPEMKHIWRVIQHKEI